jgi:hypothetical protein
MLNWNPLWPVTSDEGRHSKEAATILAGNGALWNPASLLEYQAYFWSQIIDANRNFWSMCAAAFPGMPAAAAVAATANAAESAVEPAATHAVEDLESVLESQTRFWNHLLDANRSLWTGVTWNVPDMPFGETAATTAATTVATTSQRSTSSAAKHARPAAKKSAPAKKTQRKH